MSKLSTAVMALLLSLAVACVTVNLNFNFPQKAMQDKLYQQELQLEGKDKPESGDKKNDAAAFDPQLVLRQDEDKEKELKVTNPAIEKIKESRHARAAKVKEYLASGWVGEGGDGRLSLRDDNRLVAKDKADFTKLINAENADREKFIKEVLTANGYDEKQLDKIRSAFAHARKRVVAEGSWIQTKKGTWKKKTADDQKVLDEGKDVEQ